MRTPAWLALAALAATPAPALARDGAAAADTGVVYFTRGPGPLAALDLAPYADLILRHDAVHDRPGADDFDRQRATLRAGLAWARPAAPVRIEAGVRASLGSDRNRETWSPFDNAVPDTVELDRAGVRLVSLRGDALALGKMRMPLALSELLWDPDLRPVGAAAIVRLPGRALEGVTLAAAALTRSRFERDDPRLLAGQLAIVRGNPATAGATARWTGLAFAGLDGLPGRGLARQNRVVGPAAARRLAEDFTVLDLQLDGHVRTGPVLVTARLDGALNVAADADRRAYRVRLAAGGAGAPGGVEIGWAHQRIEREALPGAFNSDDWWFHSRARGHAAFVHVGLGRPLGARAAWFVERRDDVADDTRRLIVELTAAFGE